jgi:DnaJ-class molecular chaperone
VTTTRKRPARRTPVLVSCEGCTGTGQVTRPVTSRRNTVARQEAVCLDCLGTGQVIAPATE